MARDPEDFPCVDHGIAGCADCGHWQDASDEAQDGYERIIAGLRADLRADRLVLAAVTAERDALKDELLHERDRVACFDQCSATAAIERDAAIRERDRAIETRENANAATLRAEAERDALLRRSHTFVTGAIPPLPVNQDTEMIFVAGQTFVNAAKHEEAVGRVAEERDGLRAELAETREAATFTTDSRDHWRRLAEAASTGEDAAIADRATLLEAIEEVHEAFYPAANPAATVRFERLYDTAKTIRERTDG